MESSQPNLHHYCLSHGKNIDPVTQTVGSRVTFYCVFQILHVHTENDSHYYTVRVARAIFRRTDPREQEPWLDDLKRTALRRFEKRPEIRIVKITDVKHFMSHECILNAIGHAIRNSYLIQFKMPYHSLKNSRPHVCATAGLVCST